MSSNVKFRGPPIRIGQVTEFPLPDSICASRLLELYCRGLDLALADRDHLIAKTEGASPALIQEMMRKAALTAAEENLFTDGRIRVNDTHCDAALHELMVGGGELTRHLLGFEREQ